MSTHSRMGKFLRRIEERHSPEWYLLRKAQQLTFNRPLSLYPGWCFGAGWDSNDPAFKKRKHLWHIFNQRKIQRPLRMTWYDNLKVNVYLGNDISRCLFINGCYEPNEFFYLQSLIKPGMTCIDCGANDGLYSMFLARRAGPEGMVLAIEPSTREFDRLLSNIRLNALNNIRPLRVAVSAAPSQAMLNIASYEHEGQNTLGAFVHEGVTTSSTEAVTVATIDELVAKEGLRRVRFIKLDIEGAEYRALMGGQKTLRQQRPYLLLEANEAALNKQQSTSSDMFRLLRDLNYNVLVFDDATGAARRIADGEPLSSNIVAAPIDS